MVEAKQEQYPARIFPFRYSEVLLRNIMENAAVGMVLICTSRRVMYANRAFGEMLGYDPAELIGFGPENLMHPDYVADAHAQIGHLVAAKAEEYRAERRYIRKDGSTNWLP